MNINLLRDITSQSIKWLLPDIHSHEATTMLLAIALQESEGYHRRQHGGPARGYWQFEPIAVLEVAHNPATAHRFGDLCAALDYPASAGGVAADIEKDMILAACIARLLLYTHPDPLPTRNEGEIAYRQYLNRWAPGKPQPDDWDTNWDLAHHTIRRPAKLTITEGSETTHPTDVTTTDDK